MGLGVVRVERNGYICSGTMRSVNFNYFKMIHKQFRKETVSRMPSRCHTLSSEIFSRVGTVKTADSVCQISTKIQCRVNTWNEVFFDYLLCGECAENNGHLSQVSKNYQTNLKILERQSDDTKSNRPLEKYNERLEWKLKGHLQSDIKEEEEEVSAEESS